jgi:hypothetical protein
MVELARISDRATESSTKESHAWTQAAVDGQTKPVAKDREFTNQPGKPSYPDHLDLPPLFPKSKEDATELKKQPDLKSHSDKHDLKSHSGSENESGMDNKSVACTGVKKVDLSHLTARERAEGVKHPNNVIPDAGEPVKKSR